MKKWLYFLTLGLLIISCGKEELVFTTKTYEKKSTVLCKDTCTSVKVSIPVASNVKVVADSINNKIFSVAKEIIYFGEKPYTSTSYEGLLASFIGSYEQLHKDFPDYSIPWKATVEGNILHQSEEVLNIKIDHYSFTGGAHGYGGLRSILIDPKTGRSLHNTDLFTDVKAFEKLAEQKFRKQFAIADKEPINSKGMMFEEEKFQLPANIFFTKKGLLLYYNQYEIASYAEGAIEIVIPYNDLKDLLKIK